ncbi:MAG: spore cortex-lytic protein [Ruminococcaceae bacterium]|nr:spore cortex-lytic protein [Oscillospiraceae bacterium]
MNGAILPIIPENITVHLGRPNEAARNVTVSFADYIKNVASSEIYPTWPESAIRANILAQISFALNRIYTEYYASRGYDFDITNSTTIDQSFVYGRDIFENISQIVDEIFNDYIRRRGSVEPLFALYCDGIEVQCGGLSQWGSVRLAESGLTPYEILQYYYNDDIDIVNDAPVEGLTESYPGTSLRLGTVSDDVNLIQTRLNRISKNYPGIPKITDQPGVFAAGTEDAVRAFQRQFDLTPDGVVGRATWYAIARIYGAVKNLTDINSEGVPLSDVTLLFNSRLEEGDTGIAVNELQYFLAFIAAFNNTVRPVNIDGIFGPTTRGAVEDFQYDYGLTVDGIVGEATWRAIYGTYRNLLDSLPDNYFTSFTEPYPGEPLRIGSRGASVSYLQNYLNRISDVYTSIPKLSVDGVYGSATANAVREFQRIFGLEETGVTAAITWLRISDIYRTIVDGEYGSDTQFGTSVS